MNKIFSCITALFGMFAIAFVYAYEVTIHNCTPFYLKAAADIRGTCGIGSSWRDATVPPNSTLKFGTCLSNLIDHCIISLVNSQGANETKILEVKERMAMAASPDYYVFMEPFLRNLACSSDCSGKTIEKVHFYLVRTTAGSASNYPGGVMDTTLVDESICKNNACVDTVSKPLNSLSHIGGRIQSWDTYKSIIP